MAATTRHPASSSPAASSARVAASRAARRTSGDRETAAPARMPRSIRPPRRRIHGDCRCAYAKPSFAGKVARRMRRLALLFLAFSCAGSAPKAAARAPSAAARRLTIVGINDTHGALLPSPAPKWTHGLAGDEIGGADWFAGYLDALRAEARETGSGVIVLDAGDEFQGTLISNQFQGKSVTDVYNAMGVTASALGNHEFDFGRAVLENRIAQARYPILAANVFRKGTRQRPDWARPSALVEAAGVRVGIIGLATRETATVTNPVNVSDLEFAEGGPIAAAGGGPPARPRRHGGGDRGARRAAWTRPRDPADRPGGGRQGGRHRERAPPHRHRAAAHGGVGHSGGAVGIQAGELLHHRPGAGRGGPGPLLRRQRGNAAAPGRTAGHTPFLEGGAADLPGQEGRARRARLRHPARL